MHFSLVLFVMEIFLTPDLYNERITEGETPPAPMIRALLPLQLSISFK